MQPILQLLFTPSPSPPCSSCLEHFSHILSSSLTPDLSLLSPFVSPMQSWLAPHVAGLLTGLVCCNDASPYVCAAAAGLNREDKCGILNIRAIVSLPLCCQVWQTAAGIAPIGVFCPHLFLFKMLILIFCYHTISFQYYYFFISLCKIADYIICHGKSCFVQFDVKWRPRQSRLISLIMCAMLMVTRS